MSFTAFSQEKKQQKLLIILVITIITIIFVVYFGFFNSKVEMPETFENAEALDDEDFNQSGINPDFLFLQDSRFKELKKYGEWPIVTGKTGRSNPFQPSEGIEKIEEIEKSEEIETIFELPLQEKKSFLDQSLEDLTTEEMLQLLQESE